jgi:endonuclease-3
MNRLTKKERAALIIAALEKEYPLAACTLDYADAWQLLVSVRLAAQCTDARVNIVTPKLFGRFPTAGALADASVAEIEEIVRPCGLGASKARDISACMKTLVYELDGRVPDTMEGLLALSGVGRKSANLILGDVFHKPAVVCDTHCIRITNRLGLAEGAEPERVERQLREILPPDKSNDFCHRMVLHGRAVCTARGFCCDGCCLNALCEKRI